MSGDMQEASSSLPDSWYAATDTYSRPPGAAVASEPRWDFVALVSAVSQVYRNGEYLAMMKLNGESWLPLGHGTTFRVSRSNMKVTTVSAGGVGKEIVATRLVLKRNDEEGKLSHGQIRSFVKEIRVLDHMRHHPFIVSLRAIGWFDEYSPELDRYSKPGIILEEASDTLDRIVANDISLPYPDLLRIFGQITAGLCALHRAGVAHGDLKPGNILLFTDYVNRDNTQFETYSVKISDFGSAVFRDEGSLRYSPGTNRYTAPEVETYCGEPLQFDQILHADTWSLGILFAVVLCRSRRILKDASECQNVASRIRLFISSVQRHLESSAADGSETDVLLKVIRSTLKKQPSARELSTVEENLRPFVDVAITEAPNPLRMLPDKELYLGYESLKSLSGPFKDDLVRALLNVTRDGDHRAPKALWELGIIFLTHFADPHHTVDDGLCYIRKSAEAGDVRAMALCYRLHDAFGSHALSKSPETQRMQWLQEAAACGHQSAVEELRDLDSSAAIRAQAAFAARFYQPTDDNSAPDPSLGTEASGVSVDGSFPLHKAAAMGLAEDLKSLVIASGGNIDQKDNDGNTPLIAACRFGQPEIALILLDNGADAALRNAFGENALHYVWCFNAEDGGRLARRLLAEGAKADDISERTAWASELDIRPVVRGTPLERAAARGRDDLVLIFLESGQTLRPSNGRLARQLLFWSLALPNPTLLELIITAIDANREYSDESLSSVTEGRWTFNGERRNLLDAVCSGWLSYRRQSYDIPMRLWLAACHGAQWKSVQYDVMRRWMQFVAKEGGLIELMIDQSVQWAFDESFHDAFMALLRLKVELGGPLEFDTWDRHRLMWKPQRNLRVIRPQEARLIDCIFYNANQGGTLAHQALMKGDRYMFWILVHRYYANPAHPIPLFEPDPQYHMPRVPRNLLYQMNAYAALVYTNHHDLWFGRKLTSLKVPLNCPWDENPYNNPTLPINDKPPTYLPPLLHAIGNSWQAYALWLLHNGASFEDQIESGIDVLGGVMASRSRDQIRFVFQGCNATGGAAQFLPSLYVEDGGYHVLCLYFRATHFAHRLKWSGPKSSEGSSKESEESAYEYLLEVYPEAEGRVTSTRLGTITRYSESTFGLTVQQDVSVVSKVILTLRSSTTEYRNQKLIEYCYGSPADVLSPADLTEVMANCPGLTLRHFAPSMMWNSTLQLWVFPPVAILELGLLYWFIGSDLSYWHGEDWLWSTFPKIVMVVTLALTGFVTYVVAMFGRILSIPTIDHLWPYLRPLSWASALVFLNWLTPILLSIVILILAVGWSIAATVASF